MTRILLVVLLVAWGSASATAAQRPSIVFVLTDDMALRDLVAVPRIRALVGDEGATFTHAFVNVSLCCPSRATILTGRYAHNTGIHQNAGPNGGFLAFRGRGLERETAAVWLQAAGYRTSLIGKYLNGYRREDVAPDYIPPGWDDWVVPLGTPHHPYEYALNDNGREERHGSAPEDFFADVMTQKALRFIDGIAADPRPFFLYLGYIEPHQPSIAAPRHTGLVASAPVPRDPSFTESDVTDKPAPYQQVEPLTAAQTAQLDSSNAARHRSLLAVDEAVAAIVERLRALGQLERTYIVFTSDNGFRLGHHRLGVGKETTFDEDIRVPLLIRGPGVAAGSTVEQLTVNADFAPTFADWAGVRPPASVDGRSLAPLLRGEPPRRWRRSLPVAHWPVPRLLGVFFGRDPILRGMPYVSAPELHGFRSRRWLYTRFVTGERELYDLRADPWQLDNIATTADAELIQALDARTRDLAACSGDRCRELEDLPLPEPPPPTALNATPRDAPAPRSLQ